MPEQGVKTDAGWHTPLETAVGGDLSILNRVPFRAWVDHPSTQRRLAKLRWGIPIERILAATEVPQVCQTWVG